jgi:hypothetical protein
MLNNNLAIFGSPYHPSSIDYVDEDYSQNDGYIQSCQFDKNNNYRPLPTCWNTIIDLEKIDINQLNFIPGYPNNDINRYKQTQPHVMCGSKINLLSMDYKTEVTIPSIKYNYGSHVNCNYHELIKRAKLSKNHYTLKSIYDKQLFNRNAQYFEEYYWNNKLYGIHTRSRHFENHKLDNLIQILKIK